MGKKKKHHKNNKTEKKENINNLEIDDQPKKEVDFERLEIDDQPKKEVDFERLEIDDQPKKGIDFERSEIDDQPKKEVDFERSEIDDQPKKEVDFERLEIDAQPKKSKINRKKRINNKKVVLVMVVFVLIIGFGWLLLFNSKNDINVDFKTAFNNLNGADNYQILIDKINFSDQFIGEATAFNVTYDFSNNYISHHFDGKENFYINLNEDNATNYFQDINNIWKKDTLSEQNQTYLKTIFLDGNPLSQLSNKLEHFEKRDGKYVWETTDFDFKLFHILLETTDKENHTLEFAFTQNGQYLSKLTVIYYENEEEIEGYELLFSDMNELSLKTPAIDDCSSSGQFILTPEKRMELILKLLEYDAFAIHDYDDLDDLDTTLGGGAYFASFLQKAGGSEMFTDEKRTLIEENYNLNPNFGFITLETVKTYYQEATNQELPQNSIANDRFNHMQYLPDLEIFISKEHIFACGGNLTSMTFSCKMDGYFHYVEAVSRLEDNQFLVEVYDYSFGRMEDFAYENGFEDFLEAIWSEEAKEIFKNYILLGIKDDRLNIKPDKKTDYILRLINDDWYFVSRTTKPLN